MNARDDQEQVPLPLLPRIRMIWFFVAAAVVAVVAVIMQQAEEGRALAGALAYSGLFFLAFFGLASLFFLVAYMFGATEQAIDGSKATTSSPFTDAGLPPQVIPPRGSDEIL